MMLLVGQNSPNPTHCHLCSNSDRYRAYSNFLGNTGNVFLGNWAKDFCILLTFCKCCAALKGRAAAVCGYLSTKIKCATLHWRFQPLVFQNQALSAEEICYSHIILNLRRSAYLLLEVAPEAILDGLWRVYRIWILSRKTLFQQEFLLLIKTQKE